MNELEIALQNAMSSLGTQQEANKAYLEFIKANFIIPIEKKSADNAPEVLFIEENDLTFLPVFTTMGYLDHWAKDIKDKIQLLHLSGVDLLKGVEDHVYISLNIGSPLYKEFNPAELARMRSMVLKLFK